MSYTIEFSVNADGALIVFDSVTTGDAAGTYGIRTSDGVVIVAAGQQFQQIQGQPGVYVFIFDQHDPLLEYEYSVNAVLDGVSSYITGTITRQTFDIADGRYATYAGMKQIYGEVSLRKWGSVNGNDDGAYASAVSRAIQAADTEVDGSLLGGPYDVPFTGTIPPLIKEIANNLAGLRLYEAQGVVDYNTVTGGVQHKFQFNAKRANEQLRRIKTGRLRLTMADGSMLDYSSDLPETGNIEDL